MALQVDAKLASSFWNKAKRLTTGVLLEAQKRVAPALHSVVVNPGIRFVAAVNTATKIRKHTTTNLVKTGNRPCISLHMQHALIHAYSVLLAEQCPSQLEGNEFGAP